MVHGRQATDAERPPLCRRVPGVAQASVRQAEQVRQALTQALTQAPGRAAQRPRATLDRFQPLIEQVIAQIERRVLGDERVPANEKVLRLFAPHPALIRRGKARQATACGNRVVRDEVEGGPITRSQGMAGMERWVGWVVIAHTLRVISRAVAGRRAA